MSKLIIPVILGTARKGRVSERVATFVAQQVRHAGHKTQILDPRKLLDSPYTHGSSASLVVHYKQIIQEADGFILVTPEYNHGYPGELKLLMDQAYDEYARKPVAVVGVSNGPIGGARVVDLLRPTLTAYNLVVSNKTAYFPNATRTMKLTAAEDGKRLAGLIEEVAWFAQTLKDAQN